MRQDPDTFEMIRTLSEADTFEQSLRELEKSVEDRTLPDLLTEYQARSALSTAEIADSAPEQSYTYQYSAAVRNQAGTPFVHARVVGADLRDAQDDRLAHKGICTPGPAGRAIIIAIRMILCDCGWRRCWMGVGEARFCALIRQRSTNPTHAADAFTPAWPKNP
jgi:hypothetical protein